MSIPPPPGPPQPQGSQEPYGPYAQGQYPPPPPGHQHPPSPPAPYPYGTPPGPYPYSPYGPYGRPTPVNGVAIGALVLGILCFLPAVGLVLGLIALAQIKRRGERGRGMAIAGSVLSSVGLALWVVSLSTGVVADAWNGFKDAAKGDGTAYALAKGDCFDSPSGMLEDDTYDVDEVPCTGRHDAEVFAVVTLPGGSFPGDDEVGRTADDKCFALQDTYTMDTWAVPSDVDIYYFVPSRESWRLGDRMITCMYGSREEKGTLTGSLRSDPTTLTSDQSIFLSALNSIDTTLYEEPETYPDEDLAANRAWAKDVHAVLGESIEALRGRSWPAGAQKPVADLVREMRDAAGEWAKAARADDADAYEQHYDQGYEYVDGPTTVAARKALGLATTPPSYDGEGAGAGTGSGGGMDV